MLMLASPSPAQGKKENRKERRIEAQRPSRSSTKKRAPLRAGRCSGRPGIILTLKEFRLLWPKVAAIRAGADLHDAGRGRALDLPRAWTALLSGVESLLASPETGSHDADGSERSRAPSGVHRLLAEVPARSTPWTPESSRAVDGLITMCWVDIPAPMTVAGWPPRLNSPDVVSILS